MDFDYRRNLINDLNRRFIFCTRILGLIFNSSILADAIRAYFILRVYTFVHAKDNIRSAPQFDITISLKGCKERSNGASQFYQPSPTTPS